MATRKYQSKSRNSSISAIKNLLTSSSWTFLIVLLLFLIAKYYINQANASDEVTNNSEFWSYDGTDRVNIPEGVVNEEINYHGFTVYFNGERHTPNAVAYEITAKEASGEEPRYNKFSQDPNVDGCPTPSDYTGSGYDRGHMAPAADMKWDNTAMKESFFMTNICPQNQKLNRGTWNAIEMRVHDWAKRDSSIVVVCGPIYNSKKPKTIGNAKVAVPDAFFKVILANRATPKRAIGFILPNKSCSSKNIEQYAVTVDEVEKITNFDFFHSLPDSIENVIESEFNFIQWTSPKF